MLKIKNVDDYVLELLDDVDFIKIRESMIATGWTWRGDDEPPSISRLVLVARDMVLQSIEMKENISSGGFHVEYIKQQDVDNVRISFIITESEI